MLCCGAVQCGAWRRVVRRSKQGDGGDPNELATDDVRRMDGSKRTSGCRKSRMQKRVKIEDMKRAQQPEPRRNPSPSSNQQAPRVSRAPKLDRPCCGCSAPHSGNQLRKNGPKAKPSQATPTHTLTHSHYTKLKRLFRLSVSDSHAQSRAHTGHTTRSHMQTRAILQASSLPICT